MLSLRISHFFTFTKSLPLKIEISTKHMFVYFYNHNLSKETQSFLYYLFSRFQRLSNSYFSDATQIIRHWKKPSGNVGWPENCCRIMHCTCSTTFPSLNSFFSSILYTYLIFFFLFKWVKFPCIFAVCVQ